MKKLRVGVLFGGRSGEHEVSLVSAASVLRGLDQEKYEVIPIGVTKKGRWVLPRGSTSVGELTHANLRRALVDSSGVLLPAEPTESSLIPADEPAASPGRSLHLDVVFPVLHGTYGEDGTVQGLLELADLPYVGAGVLGSALGMDKETAKRLFLQAGLPVPAYVAVRRHEWEGHQPEIEETVRRKLRFPVFTKPANLGSSVGISKVRRPAELAPAVEHAFEFDAKILIEKGIAGREIEVAVLGNEEPQASVPGEVIPARDFYDYTAKYLEDTTRFVVPAKLSTRQTRRFQELAVAAFRALECEGMARVDFLLARRTGKIFVNELNTIPGFTPISMYPKLWAASGLSYPALLDRLIQLALGRHRRRSRRRTSIELPAQRGGVLRD